MAVKMVMPMMPPKARAQTLTVPAVPRRKEGTERERAAALRILLVGWHYIGRKQTD